MNFPCWSSVLNRNLVASILVQVTQLLVGYKLISHIAPTILKNQTVLLTINSVSSFFSMIVFKFIKRKIILFLSVTLSALDLFFLSYSERGSDESVFLLLLFLVIFNSTLANLPTVYEVEVLEPGSIGLGCGLVGIINFGATFLIAWGEDTFIPSVGEGAFLVGYGISSLVLMMISLFIMSEPLEKVEYNEKHATEVKIENAVTEMMS